MNIIITGPCRQVQRWESTSLRVRLTLSHTLRVEGERESGIGTAVLKLICFAQLKEDVPACVGVRTPL